MMDKIEFNREKYKLGHTMVFFRAGGLALLEEARDAIVLKLVRQLQAEVYKKIKSEDWKKRRDQKELIRVCQRQFRKFIALRDWGEYAEYVVPSLSEKMLFSEMRSKIRVQ